MSGRHFTFLGWVIFLLLLYAWSKTKTGYAVIYYSLILILLLMFTQNYVAVENVMTAKDQNSQGG